MSEISSVFILALIALCQAEAQTPFQDTHLSSLAFLYVEALRSSVYL